MQLFAYLAVLFVYVCVASLGLAVCLAFSATASYRQRAKCVAGGIVGSFPGVFLFQALSVPLVVPALLLFLWLNQITGELSGASQVIYSTLALLSTFGLFTVASITGFLVGWGVGYRVASGASLRFALQTSRVLIHPLRVADRLMKKNAV